MTSSSDRTRGDAPERVEEARRARSWVKVGTGAGMGGLFAFGGLMMLLGISPFLVVVSIGPLIGLVGIVGRKLLRAMGERDEPLEADEPRPAAHEPEGSRSRSREAEAEAEAATR